MKKIIFEQRFIFALFSMIPLITLINVANAYVQISDFCGNYNININGLKGTLQLILCSEGKNYNLQGTYTNDSEQIFQVKGFTGHLNQSIPLHKITFYIDFPQNRQMFEGYLMCESRDAIAGYTIENKVPVGFYAIKMPKYQMPEEKQQKKSFLQKPIKDKLSDLKYILKDIRYAILIYNGQHHRQAKLGFIWDERTQKQIAYTDGKDVMTQLLQRTDKNGLTNTNEAQFGPYFHEFRINPFTLGNTIHIIDSPLPIKEIITSAENYDWIFNVRTSEFRAGGEVVLPDDISEHSLQDF
ncbi:MAG: hypothetical protein AB1414_09195 [bacterium]